MKKRKVVVPFMAFMLMAGLAGCENKPVESSQSDIKYSFLKNVTAADFVQYMYDNGRRNYLFADDEFNFEDAMTVESAKFLYDNDIL